MANDLKSFIVEQTAFEDAVDKSVDALQTSVNGISADVTFLKDTITKLQNTPGTFSAEDQALVDALQSRTNATAGKLQGVTNALLALDELTPPVAPPAV